MSIAFRCPQCGKAFSVADGLAGKKARCKECGLRMTVPYGSEVGLAFPEDLEMLEPGTEGPPPSWSPTTRASPPAEGASSWGGKGSWGIAIAVVVVILRIAVAFQRHNGRPGAPPVGARAVAAAEAPGEVDRRNAAAFAMPPLPERGPGREVEPGVKFQAVRVGPGESRPGVPPAHGMILWLYLPTSGGKAAAPGSLPCVLVPPAGSPVITGMELAEGDRPEHLPYARAGFAVLSYSLDGPYDDQNRATGLARASAAFLAARAGLSNAKVALEWLRERVPEVDPDRVYAAGHSSAGTAALLLAENGPAVKAVAAFAPRSDSSANFDAAQVFALRRMVPGVDEFFTTYNPAFHAERVAGPVFLFHARDDGVVPLSETEAFAARLRAAGKDVTLDVVPGGDHYQSMIDQGVPRAIAWLKALDAPRRKKPPA